MSAPSSARRNQLPTLPTFRAASVRTIGRNHMHNHRQNNKPHGSSEISFSRLFFFVVVSNVVRVFIADKPLKFHSFGVVTTQSLPVSFIWVRTNGEKTKPQNLRTDFTGKVFGDNEDRVQTQDRLDNKQRLKSKTKTSQRSRFEHQH